MFGNKKELESAKMETVIGPDTFFQGNIRSKGFVRVDGQVEGGIAAEGVIVGEKASVTGDIVAKSIFVAGKVTGNVTAAASLELQPSGKIAGDIRAAQLSISDGAVFEGRCTMTPEKTAGAEVDALLEKASA